MVAVALGHTELLHGNGDYYPYPFPRSIRGCHRTLVRTRSRRPTVPRLGAADGPCHRIQVTSQYLQALLLTCHRIHVVWVANGLSIA